MEKIKLVTFWFHLQDTSTFMVPNCILDDGITWKFKNIKQYILLLYKNHSNKSFLSHQFSTAFIFIILV